MFQKELAPKQYECLRMCSSSHEDATHLMLGVSVLQLLLVLVLSSCHGCSQDVDFGTGVSLSSLHLRGLVIKNYDPALQVITLHQHRDQNQEKEKLNLGYSRLASIFAVVC